MSTDAPRVSSGHRPLSNLAIGDLAGGQTVVQPVQRTGPGRRARVHRVLMAIERAWPLLSTIILVACLASMVATR